MKNVIKALDKLKEKKIILDYVIGGATALIYYSSPTFTEDIDVFISFKDSSNDLIVDISPIYQYLEKNFKAVKKDEYIIVGGIPVQFLLPYDDLSSDAFENSEIVPYQSIHFKIFKLEYLMAIMIQLGKSKYLERLRILLSEETFDQNKLMKILEKYNLKNKWRNIQRRLS